MRGLRLRGRRVVDLFPVFGAQLTELLRRAGEDELAGTVAGLRFGSWCPCQPVTRRVRSLPGIRRRWPPHCQSFRTVSASGAGGGPTIELDVETGLLVVDVVDHEIVFVEALDRPALR